MVQRLHADDLQAAAEDRAATARKSWPLLAVTLVLVGIAAWLHAPNRFGGLLCSQCENYFVAFHAQLTSDTAASESTLDEKQVAGVATHLAQCDLCRAKFLKRYPGVTLPPALLSDDVAQVTIALNFESGLVWAVR